MQQASAMMRLGRARKRGAVGGTAFAESPTASNGLSELFTQVKDGVAWVSRAESGVERGG
jgi:hypothetical protein